MAAFLVERYLPAVPLGGLLAAVAADREAAVAMSTRGLAIRHVRTIYVPGDETCYSLFEAWSEETVRAANAELGLPFSRIVEAIEIGHERFEQGIPSAARPRQ